MASEHCDIKLMLESLLRRSSFTAQTQFLVTVWWFIVRWAAFISSSWQTLMISQDQTTLRKKAARQVENEQSFDLQGLWALLCVSDCCRIRTDIQKRFTQALTGWWFIWSWWAPYEDDDEKRVVHTVRGTLERTHCFWCLWTRISHCFCFQTLAK